MSRTEINEQLLLKGLAANDTKAVEAIYKQNFNTIQTLILNNNGTYDDARDIFQEAMIILYEKAKSRDFVLISQIGTYLYSVCKRLWLKRLQHQAKYYVYALNESIEEMIPVEEDIELMERKNVEFSIMERALNSLGEPCKSLLETYYLQKKDMSAITEIFGYTNTDNAKNQKYKCLVRLKKIFFAQYNIGE